MSESAQEIIIHIAPDPRDRPEFNAIRQEINKISHPAQPEVNWSLIESLALTLFRTHGVDLQTAVYYTLARSHKQGLAGFTEGSELLATMVVHQWGQLWPEQPQARADILDWFNARVGSVVRRHSFSRADLPLLYRAERALQLLCDKLQQVELKQIPRIENLLILMQNTARRLESPAETPKPTPAVASRKQTLIYIAGSEAPAQQVPEPAVETAVQIQVAPPVLPVRFPALRGFIAGVLVCLLLAAVSWFMWIKPAQEALAELSAEPEGAARHWLHQPELATYGEHLRRLESLSPLAGQRLADALVVTARKRWPASAQQRAETQRRERLLQSRAATGADSYPRIQQQLQALADELLAREQSHSGLTISYLKTAVYEMQSGLNRDVPLEELLRQLEVAVQGGQPVSPVLLKQTEDRWETLLSRYYQLSRQVNTAH